MELYLNPSNRGPYFEPAGFLDKLAGEELAVILRRQGFRHSGYHKTGKYADLHGTIQDLQRAGFRITVTNEVIRHYEDLLLHKVQNEELLSRRIKELESFMQGRDPGWAVWDHQREAAERLVEEQEWILGDDAGLGKTLSFLLSIPDQARFMVVCPLPAKGTWRREIARARPEFRVSSLDRGEFRWPEPGECLLVHWASLPLRAGDNEFLRHCAQVEARRQKLGTDEPLPRAMEWWCRRVPERVTLILDEAHEVCNGESERTKRWRFFRRQVVKAQGTSWGGTATIIQNREKEFWEVLKSFDLQHRCFPEGSETYYRALGGELVDQQIGRNKTVKVWRFPTEAARAGLQDPEMVENLAQAVLRRTSAEVYPNMPPIVRDIHSLDLTQANFRSLSSIWDRVQDMSDEQVLDSLNGAPGFTEYSAMRSRLALAKVQGTFELVRLHHEATGEPALICSYHREPLLEISRLLGGRDRCPYIVGGVAEEERERLEDAFQAGQYPFFCYTTGAGGVSLTLSRAWRLFVIDQDFRQGMNVQAEGRLRAHLQKRTCQITYMAFDHPLEQRVTEILMRKTALIAKTVNPIGNARARKRSSREQVTDTLAWLRAYVLAQTIRVGGAPQNTGHLQATLQQLLNRRDLDHHMGETLSGIQRKSLAGVPITPQEIEFVRQSSRVFEPLAGRKD